MLTGALVATFKVLSEFEGDGGLLELACSHCGAEATIPTCGFVRIEATRGMRYFFAPETPPPAGFLPEMIECRRCHYVYEMGGSDVL